MDDAIFLYGESEPEGIVIISDSEPMSDHTINRIRQRHNAMRKNLRDVTITAFGVDHGLGSHSGNGGDWRTTVVAQIRLDYLKNSPIAYARLEGEAATELLAQLAFAVAIRGRKFGDD
jgi:hypothetical protein